MRQVLGKEYQLLEDFYITSMLQLKEKELMPVNIPFVMRATLECIVGGNESAKKDFVDSCNDTIDGVAYPEKGSESSGRFKVEPNSSLLMRTTPETKLIQGALLLSGKTYANLTGPEFLVVTADAQDYALLAGKAKGKGDYTARELSKYGATPIGRGLSKDEVGKSDLWLALCHHDFGKYPAGSVNQRARKLRDEYSDAVFSDAVFSKMRDDSAMRIDLAPEQSSPTMRALFVDDIQGGLGAKGDYRLDKRVRLVGYAP